MDNVSGKGGQMVENGAALEQGSTARAGVAGCGGGAAMAALRQCELIQNMIDISLLNLQGLRTKCAASNDLTRHEIRTLEVKLVKYIGKQLQCKHKVPTSEWSVALDSFPRLSDWLKTVNLRRQVTQAVSGELSLDALLQMSSLQVSDAMRRFGSSSEECSRLNAALSCLKNACKSGGELREDSCQWSSSETQRRESSRAPSEQLSCPGGSVRPHSPSPLARVPCNQPRSISVSAIPTSDCPAPSHPGVYLYMDPFSPCTPPLTPPSKRKSKLKPPRTPPPPSRKVLHLLPGFSTLTRSKSHESQLGNRIEEVPQNKSGKNKLLLSVQINGGGGFEKIRRTESVPSDINNPVDRPAEAPQFGTLPKALTKKDHPPAVSQLDSSSNPSSTTSSTPSSPAPFQQSNPNSATPPPNPSPKGHRDSRFNFPGPEFCVSGSVNGHVLIWTLLLLPLQNESEELEEGESEEAKGESEGEYEADELDDLPSSRCHWKGPISRKASQTSVYLQEWDIPFEQLELGELIGKGRWGKVHKGRWHGEVAIRLLEIDGNNQDHLKLFKKEVMNYRQTRHENVVLFMGACMHPPHLAIITSFCKGRTLYSVVRDAKNTLDINKTRQIAQEIVQGMGYLHAKGIVHKDLKSKNVFYDTNKVIITDFGLFGISGVVQEGRRENELKLPHGWICYLAPEIVRQMAPAKDEDRLPFSKAADVYAFGTIWYELQARDWPIKNQPAESTIWQVGSGEGIRQVLAQVSLGKEVTEILSACWSYEPPERPTFTQLTDLLEKLPKLNRRLSHPGHFWKSAEFVVNLQCGSHQSPRPDIALHFNPRYEGSQQYVVCNTLQNQNWGSEERKHEMPLQRGSSFTLMILVNHNAYKVAVNGNHFLEFNHRLSISSVNTIAVEGGVEVASIIFQNTTVPYKSFINGGLYPSRMITIQGYVLPTATRFHVNFKYNSLIAFHLNLRLDENAVVRNSLLGEKWGPEERKLSAGMPFARGQTFMMAIVCESHQYSVSVNGKHCFDFSHRVSQLQQINVLEIEGDVTLTAVQV
ncbi:Kinase suppressor of Ras 1 [Acipenser ruthenus]|uniref:non-specific serine/threonine protein kinase n=2 Tax=Acipenseroidei TaxID=186622 RepID=A0A662YND8_ACIRT|nr:Kinase suppressor of Ras 1 [Acipenser ruthenus]